MYIWMKISLIKWRKSFKIFMTRSSINLNGSRYLNKLIYCNSSCQKLSFEISSCSIYFLSSIFFLDKFTEAYKYIMLRKRKKRKEYITLKSNLTSKILILYDWLKININSKFIQYYFKIKYFQIFWIFSNSLI